jgi:hypothetical protein
MRQGKNWLESLFSNDRRDSERSPGPPLLAYYWDGTAPVPHKIRDINLAGMYLLTDRRWYPNTLVTMTLTRSDKEAADPEHSIVVTTRVVRADDDGVGLAFILPRSSKQRDTKSVLVPQADRKSLSRFLTYASGESGQVLVQYMLLAPVAFVFAAEMLLIEVGRRAFVVWGRAARAGGASARHRRRRIGPQAHRSAENWLTSLIGQPVKFASISRQ